VSHRSFLLFFLAKNWSERFQVSDTLVLIRFSMK
jgi:hypothetical protein